MRSYGQHCGLAKALDAVGDRWTLLIIREIMIRGASRYTDIRTGLPGIATNLLVERLRDLETSGLIRRVEAPPPVATAVFELTDRGRALEPILLQLGGWGASLLGETNDDEPMMPHWLIPPLRLHLRDPNPKGRPVIVDIRADGVAIMVTSNRDGLQVKLGRPPSADVVVTGHPRSILKLMTGRASIGDVEAEGVAVCGDRTALARLVHRN